jgi:hypothetical protein
MVAAVVLTPRATDVGTAEKNKAERRVYCNVAAAVLDLLTLRKQILHGQP